MSETEFQTMNRAITPEELKEFFAQRDKPAPVKQTRFIPSVEWEKTFLQLIGKFVASEIKKRDERITALEKKIENFVYCGVHASGLYHVGNFVTCDGSLWHCNRDTTIRPGLNSDWTLCVKRGRDGKDSKDSKGALVGEHGPEIASPRVPTAPRTYGVT